MIVLPTICKNLADEYFRANVGDTPELASALFERIRKAQRLEASFSFSTSKEIVTGRNDNRLLHDLWEVFGEWSTSVESLYVFDIWARNADGQNAILRFSPAVVYEVATIAKLDMSSIRQSYLRCISFVTVWFSACADLRPKTVAISAFDQEGCVVWT